jgi:hypothetical protein
MLFADLERRGFLSDAKSPAVTAAGMQAFSYLGEASRSNIQDAGLYVTLAREAGPVCWPASRGDAPWQSHGKMINHLYPLSSWLAFGATLAHGSGDDRLAVEDLRDIVYVSHACERIDSPVGAPYASQARFLALERIDDIVPHLRGDATAPSSRSEVQGLISDLLNDDGGWAHLASAERTQVRYTLEWITACRSGRRERVLSREFAADGEHVALAPEWANRAAAWVAAPYYGLQGARLLEAEAATAEAYNSADYATIMQRLPPIRPTRPGFQLDGVFGADWVTREFAGLDNPRAWIPSYAKTCMMSRLAAVHLAVLLYARDHSWNIPPSLDALVPDYLPAVPKDLFAPGNARIKYVPAATQPFVYSIGEDCIDDIAAGTWAPVAAIPFESRLTLPDLIWYVAPAPPTAVRPAPSRWPMRNSAPAGPQTPARTR